jgi:HK97 gp10 family phage protein
MSLTYQLKGHDQLMRKLNKSPEYFKKAGKAMIQKAAFIAQAEAVKKAPVDTAALRKSITTKVQVTANNVIGRVGTNLEYAPYQEFGTGVYGTRGTQIMPRAGSRLVFKPKGSNKLVYARKVRGVKPKKFMQQGLQKVKRSVPKIVATGRSIINSL